MYFSELWKLFLLIDFKTFCMNLLFVLWPFGSNLISCSELKMEKSIKFASKKNIIPKGTYNTYTCIYNSLLVERVEICVRYRIDGMNHFVHGRLGESGIIKFVVAPKMRVSAYYTKCLHTNSLYLNYLQNSGKYNTRYQSKTLKTK